MLGRKREARFVESFLRLVAQFVTQNGRAPKRKEKAELAAVAATEAGFQYPAHGKSLLRLDRIQEEIHQSFNRNELGIDESTEIIADIARHGKIDGKRNDSVRLQAVRTRFQLTTGFAPSKSANLQVHARADQFFEGNKEKFAKPPPIDAIEGQEQ